TGRISIGSGDLRSMTYLAKLLAAFHRQHPRVQYEIYSGDSDGIKERIEQGLLDMGLLLEPVDTSRYQILRLPVRESWGVLVPEDSPLAQQEVVTPGDLADSPLILTTRELMRREMIRWFGPYADRIQVAASGNLPYNQTQLAREGLGIYLVIRLDCAYDGLRFVPLSPPLESGTVLAWKKTEVLSATAAALLRFAEKYVGGISDHPV
ncbi:MAG: LysR family transcriptional regulator substrate-binding protein, partial [Oscillibacter sp.]